MSGARPRVAVSACLLGEPVRFDAGHRRDHFVTEHLGAYVEFVPVCPEVEAGLGVPRPTLRLVERGAGVRVEPSRGTGDVTEALRGASVARARMLQELGIQGAVLKKNSPSCGIERVKVYAADGGMPRKDGRGVFAAALVTALPGLPVEEEGRLLDPVLRHQFLTRLFARHRLDRLFATRFTQGQLVEFHSREKLLLMAYSPAAYRELGRRVAHAKGEDRADFEAAYRAGFEGALGDHYAKGRQVNALQHVAGYFKDRLAAPDRAALADSILGYQAGRELLVEPLTLLRHYIRHFGEEYLASQTFLEPYPLALLRTVLVKLDS